MKIKNILMLLGIIGILISCGKNSSQSNAKQSPSRKANTLIGAGATFPYPLYSKMFAEYYKEKDIKVNYQSVGSGAGIQQLQNKIVDFGASDAPMNAEEMESSPAPILHIPTALGAVVITYNLPGNPDLKLTPEVLSGIFLGKIKKWDDSKISELNPEVDLPSLSISVVHRSDGSGTTYIFSDYLAKVSSDWQASVGMGKSLNWPVGLGAKGNEGVSGFIKQTPGAIGYVELVYAAQNKMPMALLQNQSGNYVAPTLAATSAAANIEEMPKDLRVSITNTSAVEGYPLSSFTYVLLYKEQSYNKRSMAQAQSVLELINWMIHEGQEFNEDLKYGKLPESVQEKAVDILKTVTYNNELLLK